MKSINNKDKGYKFMALAAFLFLLFSTCYAEAAQYGATYTPGSLGCIVIGQPKTVSVTVKNTGTLTWKPDTTFLSYHWYQGGTSVFWNGEITYLPKSVAPNETITLNATVNVNVNVPATGSYTLKWDMLGPGTWFSLMTPPVPTGDQTVEVKKSIRECISNIPIISVISTPLKKLIEYVAPKITAVVGTVTPGGNIAIRGQGFGGTTGNVTLHGKQFPSGLQLEVLEWHSDIISAKVPIITGVQDDNFSYLEVNTAANTISNGYPDPFIATKQYALLSSSAVKVVHCGHGCCDRCDVIDFYIRGNHDNACTIWCSSSGTDRYSANLKNGWKFEDIWVGYYDHDGGGSATEPKGFVKTSNTMDITVDWKVEWTWSDIDGVYYKIGVGILGPEGLSPY